MRNLLMSSEWEPQVSLPSNEKTCFPVALRKKWYLHARDLQLYCSDDSTHGDLTCRPQYIIVRNFTNLPESSITGALCFPHPYFVKPMFVKPDFFLKNENLSSAMALHGLLSGVSYLSAVSTLGSTAWLLWLFDSETVCCCLFVFVLFSLVLRQGFSV